VHAEPAQVLRVTVRECAKAHQCFRDRHARQLREGLQLRAGVAGNDSAADVEERLLRGRDHGEGLSQVRVLRLAIGLVTGEVDFHVLPVDGGRVELHVLGQVDHHRPGTTGVGDVKRLLDDARQVRRVQDEIAVLADGERHAEDVRLLKRRLADLVLRHLPREGHERHRVHPRIGDARHEVRRARPARHHAPAGPAGASREAVRHEAAALLVPGQDRADLRGLEERVVDLHRRGARIGEDVGHALPFQRADNDVGTLHGRYGGGGGRF